MSRKTLSERSNSSSKKLKTALVSPSSKDASTLKLLVINERESRLSVSSDEPLDIAPSKRKIQKMTSTVSRYGLVKRESQPPQQTEKTINNYTIKQLLSEVNRQVMLQLEQNSVRVHIPGFGIEKCKYGQELLQKQTAVKQYTKNELKF